MEEVRTAAPGVVHGRAVVAMVGVDAVHTGEEIPMDCDADSDMWNPRILRQWTECPFIMVVILMTRTVRILVIWLMRIDQYNFNAPEGCSG